MAAATLSPLPRAHASTRPALRRASGSPALPWNESVQRPRSATSSGNHNQVRAGDRFGFGAAITPELGPYSREGAQRTIFIMCEPYDIFRPGLRVRLRRAFRNDLPFVRGGKSFFRTATAP